MSVLRRVSRAAVSIARQRNIALFAALALAGCAAQADITGSITPVGARTVAFESIDGAPRPVFDRMVSALSAEAEKRDLPVVSQTGPSSYRIRAYLAVSTEKKKKQAKIEWVWDVFDSLSRRAFRLTGEEPLGQAGRDPWTQADDKTLARIAAKGFDALSKKLELPAVTQAAAYSSRSGE
jgi:hypothetical protein